MWSCWLSPAFYICLIFFRYNFHSIIFPFLRYNIPHVYWAPVRFITTRSAQCLSPRIYLIPSVKNLLLERSHLCSYKNHLDHESLFENHGLIERHWNNSDVKNFTRSQSLATKIPILYLLQTQIFTLYFWNKDNLWKYAFMALSFHKNRGDLIKR